MPADYRDRDFEAVFEADRFRKVPTISPEALLSATGAIKAQHLRQAIVVRCELAVAAVHGIVDAVVIKFVAASEIVFGAGAGTGDRGEDPPASKVNCITPSPHQRKLLTPQAI